MNGIKMIRKKLGLNQQQLAQWLGVSRSLVASYETNIRNLPSSAVLKLARMEIVMANMQEAKRSTTNTKTMQPASLQRQDKVKRAFQHQAKECAFKVHKMRRELMALQKVHGQTMAWIEMIEGLMLIEPAEDGNALRLQWLQAQRNMAVRRLAKCDSTAQFVLEVKMKELEGVGELYEKEFRIMS